MISDNLVNLAEALGSIAAKLHNHVEHWQRPASFTRPRWDFAAARELKPTFARQTAELCEAYLHQHG